ncbi:fructosamine kinase, partial [Nocardioides sp. GCM10030258]
MARQPVIAGRAEQLLGSAVVATAPVAGGDISTAVKVRLSNGRTALFKTLGTAPPHFYEREAAGLRWLAEATPDGGVPTPEVMAV